MMSLIRSGVLVSGLNFIFYTFFFGLIGARVSVSHASDSIEFELNVDRQGSGVSLATNELFTFEIEYYLLEKLNSKPVKEKITFHATSGFPVTVKPKENSAREGTFDYRNITVQPWLNLDGPNGFFVQGKCGSSHREGSTVTVQCRFKVLNATSSSLDLGERLKTMNRSLSNRSDEIEKQTCDGKEPKVRRFEGDRNRRENDVPVNAVGQGV